MQTPQDAMLWLTVSAVGMGVGRVKMHSPSMMWLPSVGASFLYRSDQPQSDLHSYSRSGPWDPQYHPRFTVEGTGPER